MPVSHADLRAAAVEAETHEEALRHFPSNWPTQRDVTMGDPALACRDALALA